MRISPLILAFALGFSFTQFAFAADSIPVNPGMWEMTSTSTTSMSPQPRTVTENECVDQTEYNVNDLLPDDNNCTLTESNVSGNTLTWTMQCSAPDGTTSSGGGEFTSDGDSGSGNMHMTMQYQGQSFDIQTSWKGKRIGSC